MIKIINKLKKSKGLNWKDLAYGLPISEKSLRTAFDRGRVDDVYMDHVCKILEIDKSVFENNVVNEPQLSYGLNKSNKIPLYDTYAIGGDNRKGADMDAVTNPSAYINIGDLLKGSESAMRVYGNSMLPNYPSGCVIGIKKVNDGIIQGGKVYVIETLDHRYVKRIYEVEGGLECYSDNTNCFTEGVKKGKPYYDTFIIPKESVVRIFRVVGRIINN